MNLQGIEKRKNLIDILKHIGIISIGLITYINAGSELKQDSLKLGTICFFSTVINSIVCIVILQKSLEKIIKGSKEYNILIFCFLFCLIFFFGGIIILFFDTI